MGGRGSLAVSHAVVMALAAIVSLAIAAIAAYAFIQSTNVSRGVVESQAQKGKVQLSEKLTLIYWAPDGNAWIANDGPVRVRIVKAYVDGVAKDINVSIDPGKVAVVSVGAGKALSVETESGAIHVLKR